MNQQQLEQLVRIFNTLGTVSTKGEDTLTMADCLRAFQQVLNELTQPAPAAAPISMAPVEENKDSEE